MEEINKNFHNLGFTVKKLIDENLTSFIMHSIDLEREFRYRTSGLKWFSQKLEDLLAFNDKQIPLSYSIYASAFSESLLEYIRPQVEEVINKRLEPSYTYTRIYYKDAIMEEHKDRPSCQYSVTLNLDNGEDWPIYIRDYSGKEHAVKLSPGYGLIYNGTECAHWRNENPKEKVYQTFLHYVDSDGPYKDHIYDKRVFLFASR